MTMTSEGFLGKDHAYRKLANLFDVRAVVGEVAPFYSDIAAVGIPVEMGIRSLIVQYMEERETRRTERALPKNVAVTW